MSEFFQPIVDSLVSLSPNLLYLAIGLLGAVENIFPPVPADTTIAFVAFLTQSGKLSPLVIFIVSWGANVLSASLVYGVARKYGRPVFSGKLGSRLLKPKHFARLEKLYHEHGTWGIFVSRFIPGVRAVISPFSGIAGLGVVRALGPVLVGSGIWYAALVFAAARLAREWDTVLVYVSRFNTAALAVLAIAIVAGAATWRIKKEQSR